MAGAENILDAGTHREKSQDSACLGAGCLGGGETEDREVGRARLGQPWTLGVRGRGRGRGRGGGGAWESLRRS